MKRSREVSPSGWLPLKHYQRYKSNITSDWPPLYDHVLRTWMIPTPIDYHWFSPIYSIYYDFSHYKVYTDEFYLFSHFLLVYGPFDQFYNILLIYDPLKNKKVKSKKVKVPKGWPDPATSTLSAPLWILTSPHQKVRPPPSRRSSIYPHFHSHSYSFIPFIHRRPDCSGVPPNWRFGVSNVHRCFQ